VITHDCDHQRDILASFSTPDFATHWASSLKRVEVAAGLIDLAQRERALV